MGRPTFATWARLPATGVVVVALGVATASWALVHASESAARAAWTVPHLTAPDGSAIALAPMPPVLVGDSLRMSLSWTLTVLAWVAVPPNPLVSPVAWPGPTQPIDWSADRWALTPADPAALAPVVVLVALVGSRWSARRPVREPVGATRVESGVSRTAVRRALLAVGVPALALWLGAVAVLVATDTYRWGTSEATLLPMAAVEPGGALLLLVVAAALVSGAGHVGALAMLAAQIATTAPVVAMWSGGSSDLLLLACALSAGATACAAWWHPVARALTDLAADRPETTTDARGIV